MNLFLLQAVVLCWMLAGDMRFLDAIPVGLLLHSSGLSSLREMLGMAVGVMGYMIAQEP